MNKLMIVLMKWLTRSTALLVAFALVVLAVGFASGKIGSLSIRVQHPVPDVEFEIHSTVPTVAAQPKTPSSHHAPTPVVPHSGGPELSRGGKTTFRAAGAAE